MTDDNQVIVFTHDILFATTLLSLFEKSKRCVYFQVTDENGKAGRPGHRPADRLAERHQRADQQDNPDSPHPGR